MTVFFIVFAIVAMTAVCMGFSKTRRPLMAAAKSAASGISAMLLVNLVSGYTGCYIAVNCATVFVATVLSLPGVVCMLALKIIYNY